MLTKENIRILELENKIILLNNTINALAFFSIANMLITTIIFISLVAKGF